MCGLSNAPVGMCVRVGAWVCCDDVAVEENPPWIVRTLCVASGSRCLILQLCNIQPWDSSFVPDAQHTQTGQHVVEQNGVGDD